MQPGLTLRLADGRRLAYAEFGRAEGQPVFYFQGVRDRAAPIALVRRVIEGIPGARLEGFDNDAHLSTLCNHFGAIAAALRSGSAR